MAGYTKGDFDANYSICPRGVYTYPDGHTEPRRFIEIRLHYHPMIQRSVADKRADSILEKYSITSSDVVCIFGGAFGWLGEALNAKTGCQVFSVDTSDYVQQVKDQSPDAELIENIQVKGYAIDDGGIGQAVYEQFKDPNPRSSIDVLQLDLSIKKDQNTLKQQKSNITHVITEEVWQLIDPVTQVELNNFFNSLGVVLIHVVQDVVS